MNSPRWRRAAWTLLPALLLLLAACQRESPPTATVERGDFDIVLREAGAVSAVNSVTIATPRLRVQLQVMWLIDEGTMVEPGDTLVIFDRTDVQKQIEDRQSELDIALANLHKGQTQQEAELSNLRSSLTYDSTSWRLSRLRLERTRYESEVSRQESELQFHQATLSLEQSQARYRAQLSISEEELRGLELKVEQARADLENLEQDYADMIMTAPRKGMVVFLKVWKGDRMGKIKVGDNPWRGSSIMELPDFDLMQVDLQVDEVDYNLVHVGDSCDVVLDAWPDRHFSGFVKDVGVLARERDDDSRLKAFDVEVELRGRDEVLKPGMNARCTIFGGGSRDVISLPVEAVHRGEEDWFVWMRSGGGFARHPVVVGQTNGDRLLISEGLNEGDEIALVDPERWRENRRSAKGGRE